MALVKCKECGKEISNKAVKCPHCGAGIKKPTSFFEWFLVVSFALFVIGYIAYPTDPPSVSAPVTQLSKPPSPYEKAMSAVKLENFSWKKGGFDNVLLATFVIRNTGKTAVKDVKLRCTTFGASNTALNRYSETIYDVVAPGKTKRISDLNLGLLHSQAQTLSCRITDLTPI